MLESVGKITGTWITKVKVVRRRELLTRFHYSIYTEYPLVAISTD